MEDLATLGAGVGARLKARKETIAIAESAAGGLISAALLAVGGASAYFLGGGVLYTWDARRGFLDVTQADLPGIRPSTEPYAEFMARLVRDRLGATWGLAESGATGPTGTRYGDAAGHCCFAIAGPVGRALTIETASPDRVANMWAFARAGLDLLDECLRTAP